MLWRLVCQDVKYTKFAHWNFLLLGPPSLAHMVLLLNQLNSCKSFSNLAFSKSNIFWCGFSNWLSLVQLSLNIKLRTHVGKIKVEEYIGFSKEKVNKKCYFLFLELAYEQTTLFREFKLRNNHRSSRLCWAPVN